MRILAAMLLVACSGDSKPETTDTAQEATTDTGTTSSSSTVFFDGAVKGTITDDMGNGVETKLLLCQGGYDCRYASTDSNGDYEFVSVRPATYAFEVQGEGGLATTVYAVTVGDTVQEHSVVLPHLLAEVSLPAVAAPLEIAPSLEITAGVDSEIEPPTAFDDPATAMAGVLVAEEHWIPVDGATKVHAQWHLSPFDYHVPNGLPVRIHNDFGLMNGDTVELWVSSYSDNAWVNVGEVTVAGEWMQWSNLPLISTISLVTP